jgi:hypothetical protein
MQETIRKQINSKFLGVFTSLILGGLATSGCSFNISTATLENAKMCTTVADNKPCESDTTQFEKNTPKLFVTADLKFAPSSTKVKADWKYIEGEAGKATDIDSVTFETKPDTSFVVSSLSAPNNEWPAGTYEVVLSLDTNNSQPIRKQFTVVGTNSNSPSNSNNPSSSNNPTNSSPAPTTTSFENVKMCDAPTNDECSSDNPNFKADTPKIFVTTAFNPLPVGSKLQFNWRLLEGSAGKEIDISTATFEITDPKINVAFSSLSIPNKGWPTGTYEVVLSVADNPGIQPVRKQFAIAP